MMCVQLVSFSVLVNGVPKGPIFTTRGSSLFLYFSAMH